MSDSDIFPVDTGRQVAHPWICDANGHVNTRFLQGFYDDANLHLLNHCGFRGGPATGIGIVDVAVSMTYSAEVRLGDLFLIRSGFRRLGTKSFVSCHEMRGQDGLVRGTCESTSVFFDLTARSSMSIPEDFRQAAQRLTLRTGKD